MKKMMTLMLLSLAVSLPISVYAEAQTLNEAIKSMEQHCHEFEPGKFSIGEAVSEADLNHDGYTDYILHTGGATCGETISFFIGNNGGNVSVFAGKPDGTNYEAFNTEEYGTQILDNGELYVGSRLYGMQIIDGKLYLGVEGRLCGGKTARGEICMRPLTWNPDKKLFEFSPVSQKRPLPENW